MQQLSKEEIIKLVSKIMDAEGTEEEINDMIALLEKSVPHPRVSDLIFYPEGDEPTAEEVVEEALSYRPIQL